MLPEFQGLFADPADDSPLTFEGEWRGDRWWNGALCSARGETWPVKEDVPDFTHGPIDGARWTEAQIEELLANGQYERNWRNANGILREESPFLEICRECMHRRRPVLDIASGPGGGAMPALLQLDPTLPVMANDAGPPVVHGWRRFFESQGMSFSVCFAAFDARKMPIASGAIEVMTSFAGFSNINDPFPAIWEAARVLASDGVLYAWESDLDIEAFKTLRARRGIAETDRLPGSTLTWTEAFEECGLNVVRKQFDGRRKLRPEKGTLGELAQEFGIELWAENNQFWLAKGNSGAFQ